MAHRTTIEFHGKSERLYKITTKEKLPVVAVGHSFSLAHTMLDRCLYGIVSNIQHAVNLDGDTDTYIDVAVTES